MQEWRDVQQDGWQVRSSTPLLADCVRSGIADTLPLPPPSPPLLLLLPLKTTAALVS